MTGELLLASVVVGLSSGWLVGIVMGKGQYGLLGDLSLGVIGGCAAVWIYQAVGLAAYAGIVGAMVAALIGAIGVLVAQREAAISRRVIDNLSAPASPPAIAMAAAYGVRVVLSESWRGSSGFRYSAIT